jgi:hypothetical protein
MAQRIPIHLIVLPFVFDTLESMSFLHSLFDNIQLVWLQSKFGYALDQYCLTIVWKKKHWEPKSISTHFFLFYRKAKFKIYGF